MQEKIEKKKKLKKENKIKTKNSDKILVLQAVLLQCKLNILGFFSESENVN